jgi:hypothetical protein
MRAIVANYLAVAVTSLVLGCSSSPSEPSDPPSSAQPVPAPAVHRITLTPSDARIGAGRTIRLLAKNELGEFVSSGEVNWTSAATQVATVSTDGVVLGRNLGQVEIAARWGTARAIARITVVKPASTPPR